MIENVLTGLVIALCLALSFLLSGMEAGVFALSRLRIRQQVRAGRPSAELMHDFLEHPENFLWTIVVGNTLTNFLVLGWVFTTLHLQVGLHPLVFAAVFIAAVFLFYTFFDLLPKMLFRRFPTRLCLALAYPFRVIHRVLRPIVALVEWCSRALLYWTGGKAFTGHLFGNREELRLLMQETAQSFGSDERAMINRVLELQNLSVRQILVAFPEAPAVEAEATVADALQLCRERALTRLPVWQTREGRRRITAILNVDTLLYAPELDDSRKVAEFISPALYFDEDLRVEVALERMQRGGHPLAVVLGRNGNEIGTVGLADILKTVFGEVKL